MILAIGIDTITINRFKDWYKKPSHRLQRIFSDEEITYCLNNIKKSAERFAVRFAIREAVFKIISSIDPNHTIPFLSLCKAIITHKNHRGTPYLYINWNHLKNYNFAYTHKETIIWHLSCTHNESIASVYIIAESL